MPACCPGRTVWVCEQQSNAMQYPDGCAEQSSPELISFGVFPVLCPATPDDLRLAAAQVHVLILLCQETVLCLPTMRGLPIPACQHRSLRNASACQSALHSSWVPCSSSASQQLGAKMKSQLMSCALPDVSAVQHSVQNAGAHQAACGTHGPSMNSPGRECPQTFHDCCTRTPEGLVLPSQAGLSACRGSLMSE